MRNLENTEIKEVSGGDVGTGATIGFIVAGPVGAFIGGAIGAYLESKKDD